MESAVSQVRMHIIDDIRSEVDLQEARDHMQHVEQDIMTEHGQEGMDHVKDCNERSTSRTCMI